MKRQKKSTTTTDIYYLECLINKLIRTNTSFKVPPSSGKSQPEHHGNPSSRQTMHKQVTQPVDNKIQASSIYQQKVLHSHLRPQSEGQNRKLNQIQMEDQALLPQKSKLLRQIKNQMMMTRQQLWTKLEMNKSITQQEPRNPLIIYRKPIKTFSINLKSSFKTTANSSRGNGNVNLSQLRNFSPIRTMTDRNADLTGWQTSEDADWV